MLKDGKIWVANNDKGENIFILPKMANRHGLVAGATGTGKTITLKVMAESFSDMGVPVFIADVKGDVAGMMCPGINTEDMQKRIQKFGLAEAGFEYKGCPVTLWDIFGQKGIPLRTTVSEIGPLLLARILELNDLQGAILNIVFKIADDNQLLLIDTKDLKAMLNFGTIACQVPLSMGFSRQEYWSGLPCPPPGTLPDLGIEPVSLMSPALAGGFFITRDT